MQPMHNISSYILYFRSTDRALWECVHQVYWQRLDYSSWFQWSVKLMGTWESSTWSSPANQSTQTNQAHRTDVIMWCKSTDEHSNTLTARMMIRIELNQHTVQQNSQPSTATMNINMISIDHIWPPFIICHSGTVYLVWQTSRWPNSNWLQADNYMYLRFQ